MFNGLKSILTPGADADLIEAQIGKLHGEKAAAKAALEKLNASAPALSLADDDKGLDDLERKRVKQERIITKIVLALPLLEERLAVARAEKRLARVEHRRRIALEKFEALAAVLTAAIDANEAVISEQDAAHRELGNEVALLVGAENFPYVNRDLVQHWIETVRGELMAAARRVPPTPIKLNPPPPRDTRNTVIPHTDPAVRHGVAIGLDPHGPQGKAPVRPPAEKSATSKVAPATPPAKPRRPLPAVPPPGTRRCRVVQAEFYPDKDNDSVVLRRGDLVDVAEDVAEPAINNGMVEPVPLQEGAPK